MDDMKLAKWLNGTESKGKDPGRVRYYYGTAIEDSADGKVKIRTDGTMITQDNQDYVELNCYGHISKGDVVRISSVNSVPAAEDGVGWGDKMHVDITLNGNAIDALEENVATIETDVDEAAKVATNYMHFDEEELSGLVIGNMTEEVLGSNVLIDAESVNVRGGDDGSTVFAKFARSLIELGRNLKTAVIKFCNGVLQITANDKVYGGQTGSTSSITCTGGDDKAEITMASVNGYSSNEIRAHNSTKLIAADMNARTSYGSSSVDIHSHYNDNGYNIQTHGSYVRNNSNINMLSNENASNVGVTCSAKLGQRGTVYNASINLNADTTNGGQIRATFYDADASRTVTVRLVHLYRLTNTHVIPNQFLYTTSKSEKDQLVGLNPGWTLQGTYYLFA